MQHPFTSGNDSGVQLVKAPGGNLAEMPLRIGIGELIKANQQKYSSRLCHVVRFHRTEGLPFGLSATTALHSVRTQART